MKFIPRLDSVSESAINAIPGINEGLNLTHLARSINSLIEGIKARKQNKMEHLLPDPNFYLAMIEKIFSVNFSARIDISLL